MVINVDNNEYAAKTRATEFKGEERTSIVGDNERSNSKSNMASRNTTVVIGDSLLKNLRQHSIGKATKSKVQVKCFPGARLQDRKHYSIPVLSAKPYRPSPSILLYTVVQMI